ncbi:MAG TPA: ABC transporter transmembrane domain-containing protein, partial [bacterium]|nr:ABC transporter transmembrane domain-containing protein [bacterium]
MARGFSGHHGPPQMNDDDVKPLKITNARMLGWFYKNLKPHWHKVLLGLVSMIAGTAAGLFVPMVLRSIFDDVIRDHKLDMLPGLIGKYLLFMLAGLVFSAVRTNVMHLLGQRFVYKVRMDCYSNLLRLGLNYFESKRSGDIMSRISNDVEAVELMVVHGTDDIISNTLHILGSVGFLFYLDWKMALVALAPLPLYVVCLILLARFIRPVFGKIRRELGEINAKLQER